VCKPCIEHGEPDSSSESILALSSNFRLVQNPDEKQTNSGDHRKTIDVWDHGLDPGYGPDEVKCAEAVQARMERGRGNPCDKHDGIHLSQVSTGSITQ
jgi:hypothetical protein